jgi:hypothetical protein
MSASQLDWADVLRELEAAPPHTEVPIPAGGIPAPWASGFRQSLGLPRGQSSDWRLELPDGSGLHVLAFANVYVAHIDTVDPGCDLAAHLATDAPWWALAGPTAVSGAVMGLALVPKRWRWQGALGGALFGAIAGLAWREGLRHRMAYTVADEGDDVGYDVQQA